MLINIATRAAQQFYALRVLGSHGMFGPSLWDVCKSSMISQMMYASSAWWRFVDEAGKRRLQSIIDKAKRKRFLPVEFDSFELCCQNADDKLFHDILNNQNHVLNFLLPPIKTTTYDLRPSAHNRIIPVAKEPLLKKNFIYRLLYKDSY